MQIPTLDLAATRGAGATLVVEASDGLVPLQLDGASECPVLVLLDGTPCAWLQLPPPGACGPGLVGEVVLRSAEWLHDRRRLEQSMRRRLRAPIGSDPEPAVSLVVCTRRRPEWVARLLNALGRLQPAPLEIILVDNDPGDADCEEVALHAGVRYVREERPGLDHARCVGVRAARGEVIGFVDDDCEAPPTWLAGLGRAFAQPGVAAVTGPVFPASLRTPQARLFEEVASFNRGLERRLFDWMSLDPWGAVHAGVGANMFFRRDVLGRPEDYFPPELDMGTPTRSGGDTYALYRVMTNGMRIAYEPGVWLFHHHREDALAVRSAVRGYGIGLSALATKLLTEHRELGAVRLWPWFFGGYLSALAARLVGSGDRDLESVRKEYLRGAVAGPAAWRRAKRLTLPAEGASPPPAPVAERVRHEPGARPRPARPELSVIVLTGGRRPAVLRRCLSALWEQTISRDRYEVILAVDTRPVPEAIADENVDEVVWSGGGGAAASRNAGVARATGDLLLLLDDDTVPAGDLLERHLESHRGDDRPHDGGRRVVIGHAEPRPASPTFVAQRVALWWHDHFARKRDAVSLTFTDVVTLNMSLPRALWMEAGGLNEEFVWRREDWELGIRLLESGAELVHEPAAVADHELTLTTSDRLAGAFMEGRGDAMLVGRWPDTASALPPRRVGRRRWRRRRDALLARALARSERARRAATVVLAFYERVGARQAWLNLFLVAERATYEAGRRAGEMLVGKPIRPPKPLDVDLAEDAAVPAPTSVAPPVQVRLGGRPIAGVRPPEGQWTGSLAEEIALRAGDADLDGLAGGPLLADEDDLQVPFLSGTVLVLGPLHRESPDHDRAAFESAGGRIERRTGSGDAHWDLIDAAIREASEPVIGMPLPGVTVGPEWLRIARRPLDGERVALTIGSGAASGERRPPTRLLGRDPRSELSWMWGEPEQYLVIRRDSYLALGGFDPSTSWVGPYGPVLDLVERALREEWLVARGEAPEVSPSVRDPSIRRRAQWGRWYARGALMSRRASRDGAGSGARWLLAYGIWPLATRLAGAARRRQPGVRHATGLSAAFAAGAIAQALRRS